MGAARSGSSTLALILVCGIGLVTGSGVTQIFTRRDRAASTADATTERPSAGERAASDQTEKQLKELAARVRELEAAAAARPEDEHAPDDGEAEPLAKPGDKGEGPQDQPDIDPRQALDDAFAKETVDPAWSRTASFDFDTDLRTHAAAMGGFQILEMTCRASTCRTVLQFKDAEQARKAGHDLIRSDYKQNCQRSVLTDANEPNEPGGGPVRSTLYFHCASERAAQGQPATR